MGSSMKNLPFLANFSSFLAYLKSPTIAPTTLTVHSLESKAMFWDFMTIVIKIDSKEAAY
jgi:hypothetical protein